MATNLRVVTLNIWNNRGDATTRTALINAELRRLEPDLVAFQEVLPDQLPDLIAGTGLHGTHQSQTSATPPPHADRYGGTAIATRQPHRIVEVLDQRGTDAPDVPWLTLAARVPLAPPLPPSGPARPLVEPGDMLFIAPTLSFRLDAEAQRERQVLALSDLDARHRTALPTIMAGDFNAEPDAAGIRYLTGRQSLAGRSTHFHDTWEVAGAGPGHTWTSDNPQAAEDIELLVRQPGHHRRIDYIFVGSPHAHPNAFARVRGAQLAFDKPVDGVWASDHFGVVADLEVGLLTSG
ncbi:endonuclease/exonuclease/phosphatase family protein [Streptomyces sp. ISL-36]|uniref:endonuclease/exonuclease/phosphatase family protein n=1 Tax=Streptomyces sp. ISL-36 TaxID=2819182 RepID=UPI001BEC5D5C|nr:endonuclease/exonuclease/phosphatase family protein [Streptomyces sp. ISL-36]MBT2442912.1 endonuclease/exonuclease/phosphatase family protein [Streptomyces sp. ISL-36]